MAHDYYAPRSRMPDPRRTVDSDPSRSTRSHDIETMSHREFAEMVQNQTRRAGRSDGPYLPASENERPDLIAHLTRRTAERRDRELRSRRADLDELQDDLARITLASTRLESRPTYFIHGDSQRDTRRSPSYRALPHEYVVAIPEGMRRGAGSSLEPIDVDERHTPWETDNTFTTARQRDPAPEHAGSTSRLPSATFQPRRARYQIYQPDLRPSVDQENGDSRTHRHSLAENVRPSLLQARPPIFDPQGTTRGSTPPDSEAGPSSRGPSGPALSGPNASSTKPKANGQRPHSLVVGLFSLRLARRLIFQLDNYPERAADIAWIDYFLQFFSSDDDLAEIKGSFMNDFAMTYPVIISHFIKDPKYPVVFMGMDPTPRGSDTVEKALTNTQVRDMVDFADAAAEWGSTVKLPAHERARMELSASERRMAR